MCMGVGARVYFSAFPGCGNGVGVPHGNAPIPAHLSCHAGLVHSCYGLDRAASWPLEAKPVSEEYHNRKCVYKYEVRFLLYDSPGG